MSLLQSYNTKMIDRTSDIQTVALLACYASASASSNNSSRNTSKEGSSPLSVFNLWVNLYRGLLDSWRMWMKRAKLDVSRALLKKIAMDSAAVSSQPSQEHKKGQSRRLGRFSRTIGKSSGPSYQSVLTPLTTIEPQIYMRCRKCSQPLSAPRMPMPTFRRTRGIFRTALQKSATSGTGASGAGNAGTGALAAARTTVCPACQLPLPRCALCLVPMDTATPYSIAARSKNFGVDKKGTKQYVSKDRNRGGGTGQLRGIDERSQHPFRDWFVWCQECRHGGHAGHMYKWFETHAVCPVAKCTCRCAMLDAPIFLHERELHDKTS
mmetsp:Transcript_6135/g.9369  ORF Transcript_6135/g.9369 Transcript_6135/m.9369 type:complete len:323 (-) Transcript_6135:346-1314(-)